MRKLIDISGKRFGDLTVLCRSKNAKDSHAFWTCKCDCGNIVTVESNKLRTGHTTSCGCKLRKVLIERNTTHGKSHTRLYRIWGLMKDRCNNPRTPCFERYGARGIHVCDEWKNFYPFYQWAISNGYSDHLSIDRIDNSKGYSPDNCQWTDAKTQNNNTRKNHFIDFDGYHKTISEWAEFLHIPVYSIQNRLRHSSDSKVIEKLYKHQL